MTARVADAADAFVRRLRDRSRLDGTARVLTAIGALPRVSGATEPRGPDRRGVAFGGGRS